MTEERGANSSRRDFTAETQRGKRGDEEERERDSTQRHGGTKVRGEKMRGKSLSLSLSFSKEREWQNPFCLALALSAPYPYPYSYSYSTG